MNRSEDLGRWSHESGRRADAWRRPAPVVDPSHARDDIDKALESRVRDLMCHNTKEGYSRLLKQQYCYVQPSPGTYPFQWWWDTCFHVFTLCALGEFRLAKANLASLFGMQEPSGFVGHMIFWTSVLPRNKLNVLQARPTWRQIRPHMSALIQPPMAAQALRQVWQDTRDHAFLARMVPKVKRYMEWLASNRDPSGMELIAIITPFESGLDWKPSYDRVVGFEHGKANGRLYRRVVGTDLGNFLRRYNLSRIFRARRFIVYDTLVNTMFVEDLRALVELCRVLGDPDEAALADRADRAEQAILTLMYDPDDAAFYDLDGRDGEHARKLKVLTFSIALPIVLPGVSDAIARRIIQRHFKDPKEFMAEYPAPSVAMNDPAYQMGESKFLWRGPTWVAINWFLYCCLLKRGFRSEAAALLASARRLIERSGFREYYDPATGEGYGARDFTWSGLILDMMRREANAEKGTDAASESSATARDEGGR